MTDEEYSEAIDQIADHHGIERQTIQTMEECGELIQQCSKMLRGIGDIEHLAEEIADVSIMLDQLLTLYDPEHFETWIDVKIRRELERINGTV